MANLDYLSKAHGLEARTERHKYGSKAYTDDAVAYNELRSRFVHEVVNKTQSYVAVEPFHLERYIDEQIFRYNNRALTIIRWMTQIGPISLCARWSASESPAKN